MSRFQNYTDLRLLNLLSGSNKAAFETIYYRYAADLNRFTFRKTGSREDAEEIVQEIFLWLWNNRDDLEKITNLKTYLFQAAKNRILNYYRAAKVRALYANDYVIFKGDNPADPEHQLDSADLKEAIEKSLTDLPERCQTAFRLSRMQNVPIARIAEQMSISHRTVENYISRALKHLRGKIDQLQ